MADRKAVMIQQTSQLADVRAVAIKSARPDQKDRMHIFPEYTARCTWYFVYLLESNIARDKKHAVVSYLQWLGKGP